MIENNKPTEEIKEEYAQKIRELKKSHEEKKMQENNQHVKPTSSRQSVEIDKISELLKSSIDSKNIEKTNPENDKNRREEIINNFSKKINNSESSKPNEQKEENQNINEPPKTEDKKEINEKQINNKIVVKKNPINIFLVLIIFALFYLLYDKNLSIVESNIDKLSTSLLEEKNSPTIGNKEFSFEDLPLEIQKNYVSLDENLKHIKNEEALNSKLLTLTNQNILLKENLKILKEDNFNIVKYMEEEFNDFLIDEKKQKQEIANLKLIQDNKKQVINSENKLDSIYSKYDEVIDKEIFPAVKTSSKDYKILKCYDLEAGSYYLTGTCKKNITKFLNENKNAKRFEIIGVVDEKDFSNFITNSTLSKSEIELKKFTNMGLARFRVLETSWFITEFLGDKVVLSPVNYTITSKKSNRGSIIRAYY